jgi:hypothetical protein
MVWLLANRGPSDENSGYALDSESFQSRDKVLSLADNGIVLAERVFSLIQMMRYFCKDNFVYWRHSRD